MNKESTAVVTISMRVGDYPPQDIALMKSEFAFLGQVRAVGHQMPAAGGGTELQLLVEFIGVAAASGIVGQLAYNLFAKISESLMRLYNHREARFPLLYFDDIKLVYDDLEITIAALDPAAIEDLTDIAREIHGLISSKNPKSKYQVILPIDFEKGRFVEWNKHAVFTSPQHPVRYWLVRKKGFFGAERIYDRKRKAFIKIPLFKPANINSNPDFMTDEEINRFLESLLLKQEGMDRRG